MPRARLSRQAIVEAAAGLADRVGWENVTLATLADELGVRSPSLYNHIDGLSGLRSLMTLHAVQQLTDVLTEAIDGRTGEKVVVELCQAYREWARKRPGLYFGVVATAEDDDAQVQAAATRVVELVAGVVSTLGPRGHDAIHAVRAIRSALHGFVTLELAGGFGIPLDVDASFDYLVDNLIAGLRQDA